MEIVSFIFSIVSFIAMVLLIFKADEYETVWSVIFAPITFHRIVFGSGWFILIPLAIAGLSFLSIPVFLTVTVIWHVIYSLCVAKAYGVSIVFTIFLIVLPGISMIVLGFGSSEYRGSVSLLTFWRSD